MTRAVGCDPTRRMTWARGAQCTVEWANLWAGLTRKRSILAIGPSRKWAIEEIESEPLGLFKVELGVGPWNGSSR